MKLASLADQVRTVLEQKAKVPIKSGSVWLKERGVMTVEVVDVPQSVTVINLEKIGSLSGISGQFQSRCDYLLLFRVDGRDAAVFVELKKTIYAGDKGPEQLRRSPPYLAYLRTLCRIEYNGETEVRHPVFVCYVLIGERATPLLAKQRVSDPQALSVESYRGIEVRRIIGECLHFSRLEQPFP